MRAENSSQMSPPPFFRHAGQQVDADFADHWLEARDALWRQQWRKRTPVRRVFGRIQMQRRAATGEGDLRNHVLFRRDEQFAVGGRACHILVLHQCPESAPGIAVSHRAFTPQPGVFSMRTIEVFRSQGVEILLHGLSIRQWRIGCKRLQAFRSARWSAGLAVMTRKKSPIPKLEDVAGRAGVSTATVSRFYNSPDVVAPATAERIREAIAGNGLSAESDRGWAGLATAVAWSRCWYRKSRNRSSTTRSRQ